MNKSRIEWTEFTWNPATGCSKISLGCKNCYAERLAKRLKAMGQENYRNGFNVAYHPHALNIPLRIKKQKAIFVNSMSDLFHDDIPLSFIKKVFETMNKAYWHNFQILTKRAERLLELANKLPWADNIWMGVTVEAYSYKHRIDLLEEVPAHIRFLSIEPLLSSLGRLNLNKIDWVIVGGESGPKARPMEEHWVREVRDQCIKQETPFFFKQWGGVQKKKNGRLLDGITWDEMPSIELAFV